MRAAALPTSVLMTLWVNHCKAFMPCQIPTLVKTAPGHQSKVALQGTTRGDFLKDAAVIAGAVVSAAAVAPLQVFADQEVTTASGLKIRKLADGKGQQCTAGDLAAVRFKGRYKDFEFDNIFDTAEPLYIRAGGSNVVKGIDEAIVLMRIGDRWELTIPGALGFGEKGRSPSPGKPRIPPNATLVYEVQLVGLPGKEGELFDQLEEEDRGWDSSL